MNTAGEVVGINTAGIPDAQNISFAIDINGVKPLLERLKAAGERRGRGSLPRRRHRAGGRAHAGRSARTSTSTPSRGSRSPSVSPGSGAVDAGIEVGDVILTIDGRDVESTGDLRNALDAKSPSDSVEVVVQRGADQLDVTATLGARPSEG